MATDLTKVESPEEAQTEEITIDDLLNTGTGTDRKVNTPPEKPADPAKPAVQADADPEKPSGKDPKEKEDKTVNEETKQKVQNSFSKFVDDAELSEDDKNLRTQLLDAYKGAGFNEKGDIIDDKGNVVKAFDDVYKDILAEEDEQFDDKGNLVDDEGTIIKTKAELDAEKSYVNKLAQESGYEFKDADGNPKTYSDDETGINEFVGDLVEVRLKEQQSTFFEQNPVLSGVAKHLLSGGTLDTYQESTDYDKVKEAELTPEQKLSYIEKSFKVKKFNDARIKASVQRIKDGNQIDEEFEFALEDLKAYDKEVEAKRDEKYQAELDRQERENTAYWESVQQSIADGKVKDITIPDADKKGFFQYLAQPVKGNLSQAMIDRQKEDIPTTLLFDFLRFKGYDLSKLVDGKAKTTRVTKLRELVAKSSKVNKGEFTSTKGASKKGNALDIRIEDIL